MNGVPGFTADHALYAPGGLFRSAGSGASSAATWGAVLPAVYGCTECKLYTEPGGGRTAGIRTCCELTCRTDIFGRYKCYEYCTDYVCWTPGPGEILV
jgi:hypothetical protein